VDLFNEAVQFENVNSADQWSSALQTACNYGDLIKGPTRGTATPLLLNVVLNVLVVAGGHTTGDTESWDNPQGHAEPRVKEDTSAGCDAKHLFTSRVLTFCWL